MGQKDSGNPQREDRKQNAQPGQQEPRRTQPGTPDQQEGKPNRREEQNPDRN